MRLLARFLPRTRRGQSRAAGSSWRGRVVTGAVCLVIGIMIAASALNARGTDLRPARNTSLADLVQAQSRHNADLNREVSRLRADVDARTAAQLRGPNAELLNESASAAGLQAVKGPGVTVTLTDAPASVKAPGVDQDLLVIHQQDIQAVVNDLWASGAEAMTVQGQRVIATTGIKCVGNTVVLHGTPYAPPYVISAIGDRGRMEQGLANSEFIGVFKQYVDVYHLGYAQQGETELSLPGYEGPIQLQYAHVRR